MKPKKIFLIRHGESIANKDRAIYSNLAGHTIPLTDNGKDQATKCGKRLKKKLISNRVFFYLSPYLRTKQTFEGIIGQLQDIDYKLREEPRIREQDFGNPRDQFIDYSLDPDCKKMGDFFYRYPNGENGADVYDRISSFFYTLHRNFLKKDYPENVVIITHGMLMRLFLTRWYHWTVEEFEKLKNPKNCYVCSMILRGDRYSLENPFPIKKQKSNNYKT